MVRLSDYNQLPMRTSYQHQVEKVYRREIMLIRIKMTNGPMYVGKVDCKTIDEVLEALNVAPGKFVGKGFFKIDQSIGPILINVENIVSITRAQ